MKNFTLFWQQVFEGAYRILEVEREEDGKTAQFVAYMHSLGEKIPYRSYQPLSMRKNRALCIEFSRLDPNQGDEILSFARTYGLLTGGREQLVITDSSIQAEGHLATGEPLELWQDEITWMKRAVVLWGMLESGDRKGLSRGIAWVKLGGEDTVRCYPHRLTQIPLPRWPEEVEESFTIAPPQSPYGPEPFRLRDIEKPAWVYLQRLINERTRGRVSPQLINLHRSKTPGNPSSLGWRLSPHNLIGALWLQLGQMVEEERGYRLCAYCGKPFLIIVGAKRVHSLFCDPLCRNSAWRRQKRQKTTTPRRAKTKNAKRAA